MLGHQVHYKPIKVLGGKWRGAETKTALGTWFEEAAVTRSSEIFPLLLKRFT